MLLLYTRSLLFHVFGFKCEGPDRDWVLQHLRQSTEEQLSRVAARTYDERMGQDFEMHITVVWKNLGTVLLSSAGGSNSWSLRTLASLRSTLRFQ